MTNSVTNDESDRSKRLLDLARARFHADWCDADELLFRKNANGEKAVYGVDDPSNADQWGEERVLKANRIQWLCTDPEAVREVTSHGVWIVGARIEDEILLGYATVEFPLGIARCSIPSGINMAYARLQSLTLEGTHTGPINASSLNVELNLHMRNHFQATGEVILISAKIIGNLDCDGGKFICPNKIALDANTIVVGGSIFLRNEFQATGEVDLICAKISGNLDCTDGKFSNPNKRAISASSIKVEGSVYMRNGFQANGEVSLINAKIGGNLECQKGEFSNPNKDAISADGIEVKGSTYFHDGFKVEGTVNLSISTLIRSFKWLNIVNPEKCTLLLECARIGTLWDDKESWPAHLDLDGLVYDRLYKDAPLGPEERLEWLGKHDHDQYLPQPYEQLAKVLKEMGHEADARKILIAKQEDPARVKNLSIGSRIIHHILGQTIGYGYRPWRALYWISAFILFGTFLFCFGNSKDLFADMTRVTPPTFNAFIYSLDTFVQLIDLHQAKYRLPTVWWLQLYHWIHIGFGWVLSSLLVVGLTGLVRK